MYNQIYYQYVFTWRWPLVNWEISFKIFIDQLSSVRCCLALWSDKYHFTQRTSQCNSFSIVHVTREAPPGFASIWALYNYSFTILFSFRTGVCRLMSEYRKSFRRPTMLSRCCHLNGKKNKCLHYNRTCLSPKIQYLVFVIIFSYIFNSVSLVKNNEKILYFQEPSFKVKFLLMVLEDSTIPQ